MSSAPPLLQQRAGQAPTSLSPLAPGQCLQFKDQVTSTAVALGSCPSGCLGAVSVGRMQCRARCGPQPVGLCSVLQEPPSCFQPSSTQRAPGPDSLSSGSVGAHCQGRPGLGQCSPEVGLGGWASPGFSSSLLCRLRQAAWAQSLLGHGDPCWRVKGVGGCGQPSTDPHEHHPLPVPILLSMNLCVTST